MSCEEMRGLSPLRPELEFTKFRGEATWNKDALIGGTKTTVADEQIVFKRALQPDRIAIKTLQVVDATEITALIKTLAHF